MKGRLPIALVLHAHLPLLRHPEHSFHLEERWLLEALSETYLPLTSLLERIAAEGSRSVLTLSVSPPLGAMLDDELLRERFSRWLEERVALATQEERLHPEVEDLAIFYRARFEAQLAAWEGVWGRDLLSRWRALDEAGVIELIPCTATHGFLPLMATEMGQRAQILEGLRFFRRRFGRDARGMWLGECAFDHRTDALLAAAGVRFTFVEGLAAHHASSPPLRGTAAPLLSARGVAYFPRDPQSAGQVWSSKGGYPGDPLYREYYRDVGFDRPAEELGAWLHPDGIRTPTGLKYHRVTGSGDLGQRAWYRPFAADARARHHGRDLCAKLRVRAAAIQGSAGPTPCLTLPFDAELFGHWWFEGPEFLRALLQSAALAPELHLTTPGAFLASGPLMQESEPAPSTWGAHGFHEVWLNEKNAWIYRELHALELRLERALRAWPAQASSDEGRRAWRAALAQVGRELLLAQASDWAFILHHGTTDRYAIARTIEHVGWGQRLLDALEAGAWEQARDEAAQRLERWPFLPGLEVDTWCGGAHASEATPVDQSDPQDLP